MEKFINEQNKALWVSIRGLFVLAKDTSEQVRAECIAISAAQNE